MGTRSNRDLNVDGVTANQTPGWVYQDVVANGVAFGVKAFEDAQRTLMRMSGNGAL
jgi:hypothetical protein